ncbi:hypothetical protein KN10_0754 [Anoxybacillus flavithermus NBRC 109594]|uniref:Uncharacterized protein n=1 Tax=Anoxybacillus flavithermus NBRC 109594 TaxID=1315967 RepID=R4FZQ7_9BACL|nr:hypothetical protein [Anoxybacillus flavithermus]GAC90318.1 hypothetical protein KN10_0754 [Anoxybacillus flavithermus NBRC 109594]
MKAKLSVGVICVILFATIFLNVNVGYVAAHMNYTDLTSVDFVENTDNLIVYRIEENEELYEYVEESEIVDGVIEVNIKKYEIKGNEKILIEESIQQIKELNDSSLVVRSLVNGSDEEIIIHLGNEESVEIIDSEYVKSERFMHFINAFHTNSYWYISEKGGSYITDTRYEVFSNGHARAIMAGNDPYYKNTRSSNGDFKVFKVYADSLRQKEIELTLIGGAIGIADAVIDAVRSGQVLNFTLIKTIAKKMGKGIPIIGTLYAIYDYAQTYIDARSAYKRI